MRFFASLTKYCAIAHTVAEIPVVVENAFKAMRNGRPGPTVLEFPMDVVTGEGEVQIPTRVERDELPPPDDADLSTAVETIRNAKMPLIFAGSAVYHANARNELRLLAEKLNAPVIVTRNGKGVLSEGPSTGVTNLLRLPRTRGTPTERLFNRYRTTLYLY